MEEKAPCLPAIEKVEDDIMDNRTTILKPGEPERTRGGVYTGRLKN
jgi:hypothetical protein